MSNTMRKNAGRAGAMVAALAIGLAVSPAVASADEAPGVGEPGLKTDSQVTDWNNDKYGDTGFIPVAFWAEGNDNCEVTFKVRNRTQSANYLVDYLIDDEKADGETYDFGNLKAGPYKDKEIGSRTVGRAGVQSLPSETPGTTPVTEGWLGLPRTATNTINLRDLKDLPNSEADEHTITYQQIEGPVRGDFGIQSELPKFSTKVTGCADSVVPEDSGSMDFSSLNFGSLFGSLGSSEATDPKLGSS